MINISKLYTGLSGQSDDLRYGRRTSAGPIVVYNCTAKCNLRCLHCYSSSESGCFDSELTTAQAKNLFPRLVEMDCPVLLFSGGEPFLRPDLFELLAEAKRLGLRTVISSNGTLIDSQVARKIADTGVSYVGVSIDGPQQFHDQFRKSKGSFESALKGIENCQNAGVRTGLRFTITKANAQYVESAFDIAASAGIRRLCFYHLIRAGRAKDLEQTLSLPQTRDVVDVIIEKTDQLARKNLVDEVLTVDNHADGPYLLVRMQKEKNPLYEKARELLLARGGNKVGEKIASIGWDGSVYADQFWRHYPLGNIKDKTFEQIWHQSTDPVLQKLRDKEHFADPRCLRCRWFDLCKGNYRFLSPDPADKNWLNEPPCYLTDEEIGV